MENQKIEDYARQLYDAESSRIAIPQITEYDSAFGIDDAYAVQIANVNRVLRMGYAVSGKKIGLTSLGMQCQLGVNEPDYGHLFSAMDCPNGVIQTNQLIQPKIEGELAFILNKDLKGGKVTVDDVDNATEYIVAAFEIVDSRVADWRIRLADTVADNASSGRYVLGKTKISPRTVNLPEVSMRLYKNEGKGSILVGSGVGAAVLGDPRTAVAWLANKLWNYGVSLNAGEVVLSGAFSAAPEARKGDVFRAEFSDFGSVEARFI